jgi:uncharacterized protein YjgD (DUF1641 family)
MADGTILMPEQQDMFDALLDPEIQASLHTLVTQIPKLAVATTWLVKGVDVATEVLTDGDMLEGVAHIVRDKATPFQEKLKEAASVAQEAKLRAENDTSRVSLFGLLRLLKDPTVQKNLRYVQAFLTVMSERDKKKSDTKPH